MKPHLNRFFAALALAVFATAVFGCGGEKNTGALIYKNKPVDAAGEITLTTEDGRASVTFPADLFKTGAKVGLTGFSAADGTSGLPEGRVPIGAAEFRLIKAAPDEPAPPADGGDGGEGEGGEGGGEDGDGENSGGEEEKAADDIGGQVTLKLSLAAGHGWPEGSSLILYKYSESLKEWRDSEIDAQLGADLKYAAAAIGKFGKYAIMSPLISEVPPPAPQAPSVEVATKTVVRLDWTMPDYPLTESFNVYRSSAADGEYSKANADPITLPTFSEKPAGTGSFFYKISVVSTSGLESPQSGYTRAEVRGTDFYGMLNSTEGTASELAAPWGIAILPAAGEVLVTDAEKNKIFVFGRDGKFKRSVGSSGFGSFKFDSPRGIAVSPDGGRVYVADAGNARIHVLDAGLSSDKLFGNSGSGLGNMQSPECVAVRADGVVFVADTGNGRIQYYTPSGTYLGHFGEAGSEALGTPGFIAFGPDGALFVSDKTGGRILKYGAELDFETSFEFRGITNVPPLGTAAGFAFGAGGAIFAADAGVGRIIVADSSGEFDYLFGSRGSQSGKFGADSPQGIAFDATTGLLYACDTANSRVQIFEP